MMGPRLNLRSALILSLTALSLSGCDLIKSEYDPVQKIAYGDVKNDNVSPEIVLEKLLSLTEIQLSSSEKQEMLVHITKKSLDERRVILSHLMTASGTKVSSGWHQQVLWNWQTFEYPVPDSTTKVQYLQQLMTTSTTNAAR